MAEFCFAVPVFSLFNGGQLKYNQLANWIAYYVGQLVFFVVGEN